MPPFIKRRGRSSRDAVKWKCGVCKRVNRPTKHLIFDLPKFRCKCGKKFEDDFHCCLSEVKVNGRLLLGDIHDQGSTEHCVAFAFAHQLEMTLRLKALLKKRNPLSVKKLCGHKLFYKFKKRCKDYFPKKESIIKKRAYIKEVHMGLILKEEGLENEDDQVCKVSNVSTIPRDDFEGIAKSIADGDSLVSSFNSGKRLSELKYGQIYKAYSRSRYRDNKRKKLTGHAVCLIGVGRKKGRPYYTFVNSWRKFCVRRNRRKKIYKWGVGRVRASDLKCSAIRLSRFSEAGDDWSLQPQQGTVLNEHNLGLMMASSRKIKNELEINVDESDDDCEAPVVTAIHDEGNSSRNGASYSTYLQNRPSSSIGVPASSIAKPSALRMPSPSVGFFSQEKALVSHEDAAQGNANNCFSRNTSSLARPPRYKQSEYVNSWLSQAPVSSGDNGQGNAKICVTRNASALAKPPRYKQPDDYKSKLCLRAPLSTNCLANSEPLVHPVSNTLASPLPGLEHDNVCSRKESLSEVRTTCFANSRNRNNEPTRKVDCFSAGSGSTTRSPGSEKNSGSRDGVSNAYIVASHVEGRGIINRTEPNEDSHSLKSMCYSTTEHVAHETICSSMEPVAVSNLSSSCISEVCTLDDFICQSKSENCAGVAIDLENSLPGETMVAVSLSEGNKCTSGPDFLRGFDSCNQQRTECSTLRKSVESATCADGVPPCGNSVDIKPASADGTTDLHGSFCNEAECNLSVEPNTDGGVDFDSDNPLIGKEVQLSVGCDWEHDYRNAESSPIEPAAHMRSADFNDLKEVTVDCTTETNDSLAVERRPLILEEPSTEEDMDLDSDSPPIGNKVQLLIGSEYAHGYRSTEFSPMDPGAPVPCTDFSINEVEVDSKKETHDSLAVERRLVLLEEPNTEDDMELSTNDLSTLDDASPIGKNKVVHKSGANTIIKNHLKQLVPFSEEWLAAMEACGEEVLEQKSGAVQNSPTDKTTPEPSPWSPVKRKAQDVGPFDCTKYSKSVRTTDTP